MTKNLRMYSVENNSNRPLSQGIRPMAVMRGAWVQARVGAEKGS